MVVLSVVSSAQEPPRFEVVSIRPYEGASNSSNMFASRVESTATGLNFYRIDLLTLIFNAYDIYTTLTRYRVDYSKADKAALGTFYDIQARGEGDQRAMLRTLLAERFGLRTHTDDAPDTYVDAAFNRQARPVPETLGAELHRGT